MFSQETLESIRSVCQREVARGDLSLIKLYIRNGVKMDFVNENGCLLHWAIYGKANLEIIEFLIDLGVPLEALDRQGYTPLEAALAREHLVAIEPLILAGADYQRRISANHITFLEYCKEHKPSIYEYAMEIIEAKEERIENKSLRLRKGTSEQDKNSLPGLFQEIAQKPTEGGFLNMLFNLFSSKPSGYQQLPQQSSRENTLSQTQLKAKSG